MAVEGTGAICLPLENLRTLLANCAAFQTWTGTADATAAKARIELIAEDPDNVTLPSAWIFWGEGNDLASDKIFGGEKNLYGRAGSADIFFTADIATTYSAYEDNLSDLFLAFLNDVGGILDDMDALAGTDEYLDVTHWGKVAGPSQAAKAETDKWVQVRFRVMWQGAAV